MEILNQHPHALAIGGAAVIILENALPYLPGKANSSVQLIINVAKAIFGKKA